MNQRIGGILMLITFLLGIVIGGLMVGEMDQTSHTCVVPK